MNAAQPRVIELIEYISHQLPYTELLEAEGEVLWRDFKDQVAVEFPSLKTNGQWELTAQGWVGQIPVTPGLRLVLSPKVELSNLFRMWEYAYRLRSFRILEGLIQSRSLLEFYERLANILAQRVLARGHKGFYRAYMPESERLPYLRGRMDVQYLMRKPWDADLLCHYDEHTADVEENRILAWTLFIIARSGICTERVLPTIRRAYHELLGLVTLQPYGPHACLNQSYNRLNDDYQPLHALCRFFLEHMGPHQGQGDRDMLPFMVNMARLYEMFVAEWLKAHIPAGLIVDTQHKLSIDDEQGLHFKIDLMLSDARTGAVRCVLDTKYKGIAHENTGKHLIGDLQQIVAYAEATGCREAILIYPKPVSLLNRQVGDIRVRTLAFSLDGDLEQAGQAFLHMLLQGNLGNAFSD